MKINQEYSDPKEIYYEVKLDYHDESNRIFLEKSDIGIIASEEFEIRKALPPTKRMTRRVGTEVNSISLPDKKGLHDIGEFNEMLPRNLPPPLTPRTTRLSLNTCGTPHHN
jgi:hypothetical protein